jgi:two-component system, LytTR family, response regulator
MANLSKMTTVIIADDEAPARKLIAEFLIARGDNEIIAECKNGIDAINAINTLQPDIAFLDIKMPGKTGIELIQEIEYIPAVIFTSAYDKYAIKAFEVNAVDYLLKPFSEERFASAMNKALNTFSNSIERLTDFIESYSKQNFKERILVEAGQKIISLNTTEILWLEACRDYTKLHTMTRTFLSRKGISELEQKLNPNHFIRIHRSTIISLSAIKEVIKSTEGLKVILVNNIQLNVSRSYTHNLKNIIF